MLVLAIARPPAAKAEAANTRITARLIPLPFTITIGISPGGATSTGQPQVKPWSQTSSASDISLPAVPTSKLFDALAPRTVYAELTLNGPQTEALDVAVAVESQSKTAQGVALLQPKASVTRWFIFMVCCNKVRLSASMTGIQATAAQLQFVARILAAANMASVQLKHPLRYLLSQCDSPAVEPQDIS